MKKFKNYDLPYSIDKEDLEDREKLRTTFIKNMDACKELRLDMWEKVYASKLFRKDKKAIAECEEEWDSFTQDKKEEWFEFVTDKDLSFIQELFLIRELVKQHNFNVVKATREYKKIIKMQKQKAKELKEKYSEEEFEEEEEEVEDEDYDYDDDDEPKKDFDDDFETPSNSLALAAMTAKDSETLKNFRELPKEIKHSFYDDRDLREVRHRLKCYKDFMYVRKNLKLQALEDREFINNRNNVYKVKTEKDLEEYYKSINKYHIFKMLQRSNLISQALSDIKNISETGINQDLHNSNERIKELYAEFMDGEQKPEFIDDVGNLGMAMDFSVTSSGKGGNERLAGITAIQATRDMDLKEKSQEKAKYNPLSSFMKRFT